MKSLGQLTHHYYLKILLLLVFVIITAVSSLVLFGLSMSSSAYLTLVIGTILSILLIIIPMAILNKFIDDNFTKIISLIIVSVITLGCGYLFYSIGLENLASKILAIGLAILTFILLTFFLKDNPVFIVLLGLCPTLAVTTSAYNGLGMGIASTFVLIAANSLISLLRDVIPPQIRIPAYITIIATFVTLVDLLMAAFVPTLHQSLGIFIPLIVVNCIILGRAEAFASKNSILPSMLDGLYKGLAFTMALVTLGLSRELLGNWSLFDISLSGPTMAPILIMILPPGAFILLGFFIAAINMRKKAI